MSSESRDWLTWLLPPDPSPLAELVGPENPDLHTRLIEYFRELRAWYWKMSTVTMAFMIFIVWAFSGYGFARADGIKPSVDEAVQPIQKQIEDLRVAVAGLKASTDQVVNELYELRATSVADQIRRLIARRCKEVDPAERGRLRDEIDYAQVRYEQYAHRKYDEPTCQEL